MDRFKMHVQGRHSVRENVCTIIIREHSPYDSVQGHVRSNASVCTSVSQHEFIYYV